MKSLAEPNWEAIKGFVAVARRGSLTEASAELGVSIATLGRRIDGLESELGLKLLRRGPTGTQVTDAGRAVLEHADKGARHMAQIVRVARALVSGPLETPVRISSTEPVISDVLAPRVGSVLERSPGLRLELEVSTDITNLNAGEADIAIRLANPRTETLIARRLPVVRLGLFCSKAYLAGRAPSCLRLSDEHLLWLDARYGDIPENRWIRERGLEPALVLRSSSIRALHRAAEAGAGIAPLPHYSAAPAGLVEVPTSGLPARQPWLVFHRDTRTNARMRCVRDWVSACCRAAFG